MSAIIEMRGVSKSYARGGEVHYSWGFSDTATDGTYHIEFIIHGAHGIQTIPGKGRIELTVEKSPIV